MSWCLGWFAVWASGVAWADDSAALQLFERSVAQVLTTRCLECHNAETQEGGLDLSTQTTLHAGGERGPAIVPGRGDDSLLIKLVQRRHEPFMPAEGEPLTPAEIDALRRWIDLGGVYHRPLGADPEPGTDWTTRRITDEDRRHWAFQPLRSIAVPSITGVSHPIDVFLRQEQLARGLTPTPPTDRRTWLRRVTRDLWGLPPTAAEVASFVADPSPLAEAQAIDRLLADPRYGERYARHWLDLARFAESHGFEHDYDRPTAYHYRDYVVRALNENQPFDEFVRWQIAGDELSPDDRWAHMATGFLAAGVHSTQITKNEVERHRYDELDDIVSTIGTAFLGLSVGCARCHDHKYDPIPQADYYRLVAAFTETVRSEVELDFDPTGYAADRARFELEHQPYVAAVETYEREQLPGRLRAWRDSEAFRTLHPRWFLPREQAWTSQGGAKFVPQPDASFLVTGPRADHDIYTLRLRTDLPRIAAVRVEALSDVSLKNGGPGRADNGNFALSRLTLRPVDPAESTTNREAVRLTNPRATFEQLGLPIAASLDDNPNSAWAVDPQFGRPHAAGFDLATPIETPTGQSTKLELELRFECNVGHAMGRVRVSLATEPGLPPDNEPGFDERVWAILTRPIETWSSEEAALVETWYRPHDPAWVRLDEARQAHAAMAPKPRTQKVLVATEGLPAVTLHTQAAKEYLDVTHFLKRGDPDHKAGVAAPGVLQVVSATAGELAAWRPTERAGSRTPQQRRALAAWLTDVERGAGALLARVAVNRAWQHHFGTGLVATSSDFGRRGEPPTHPELLDWLAFEFVRGGWDVKRLHRLIVTSAAYRQSAATEPATLAADPENRWWARWQPRRLEGEAIRDALLSVSGLLDERLEGPGTLDPQQRRRSLYFTVKRSQLIPMLTVFDGPDGTTPVPVRPRTTVAPQALWLLNDPTVQAAAQRLATEIPRGDNLTQDLERLFQAVLQRGSTDGETEALRETLHATNDPETWRAVVQMVLVLNETLMLE
jgi:hypothetical protein